MSGAPAITARKHAAIDAFLGLTDVATRDGSFVVGAMHEPGQPQFGGNVLMMVTSAACRTAPEGMRLHSLHSHFLRPVFGGDEIEVDCDVVKAGRSVAVHQFTARQGGKVVHTMLCSFSADGDGYTYDVSGVPAAVPLPGAIPDDPPDEDEHGHPDDWPWDARWLGPATPRADGTYESTHRHWFRIPRPLPDDPTLHLALFAYATDWTSTGGRPHALDGDTTGMISLDHAAWFHRPSRADDWHLMDVESLVNAGGRGTLRSVIRDVDGRIVASMAQEMLLRPV